MLANYRAFKSHSIRVMSAPSQNQICRFDSGISPISFRFQSELSPVSSFRRSFAACLKPVVAVLRMIALQIAPTSLLS